MEREGKGERERGGKEREEGGREEQEERPANKNLQHPLLLYPRSSFHHGLCSNSAASDSRSRVLVKQNMFVFLQ